ncbi:24932_t:CDS:2 [Dentiscutata erythropus]|uniref:24932_t:CDS:1 n=1 Tax=Dentiscutata erythropus TaxID=1348616 RepID=A0A9N9IPD3_9GLOM|nr:24932_t:CDS:2 [Dentiscutata erythropus]
MSAMEGYVSVKYENPGPRPNEIEIFHLDEEGKSYEPLELVEPNKPKTFKIYKQRGQYFKIGNDETYLEEIRNNQGPLQKTVQLQYTINLEYEFIPDQGNGEGDDAGYADMKK